MKFGVFLPSFIIPGRERSHPADVRRFARRAEELGFDSLWITDHIVTAHRFYRVSWLDSLMTLSHVAAVTERVRLGTSILILPTRQPAVLAKEIATLALPLGPPLHLRHRHRLVRPRVQACGVRQVRARGADRRGARGDDGAVQRASPWSSTARTTTSTA